MLLRTLPWLILALAVGCGRDRSASLPAAAPSAPVTGPAASVEASDTPPDQAVLALARGFQERRPEALWQSLPLSHRRDVDELVRDAAERFDPDVHRRVVVVLRKTAALLRAKKEFLLGSAFTRNQKWAQADDLVASWDGLVGLLETLLNSQLGDPQQIRSFDGGAFLKETGGRLMEQLAELSRLAPGDPFNAHLRDRFAAISVRVISRDGDHAELEIDTGNENLVPERRHYVRIEGAWIPKGWAENWARTRNRLRDDIAAWAEPAASKESMLATLARAERVLDELAAADDAKSFEAILTEKVIAPASAAVAAIDAANNPPLEPVKAGGDSILVVVSPALDAAGEEEWQDRLGLLADRPDQRLAVPSKQGDATAFLVSPVKDAAAYAKRIDFADAVSVDEAARRVILTRKP